MNQITLGAQLLGALVFLIAATAAADPAGQGAQGQKGKTKMLGNPKLGEASVFLKGGDGWIDITSVRVPGKIEFPNIVAKAEPQSLALKTEWITSLHTIAGFSPNSSTQPSQILLKVGEKTFELRSARVSEVEFPEMHFNPKELSVDKPLGLKLNAVVVNHEEQIVPRTGRPPRQFHGLFKGEIVGAEPAALASVEPFVVQFRPGPFNRTIGTGSMKVVLQNRPPAWLDWADAFAVGQSKVQNPPKRLHLTLLDRRATPLFHAFVQVGRVKKLSQGTPDGRSMSFEFMFQTFEGRAPGAVGPR